MSDPKYAPKNLADALYRLSEECHELGKIACKAGRFGLDDTHPKKRKTNLILLREEFRDIETALIDVLNFHLNPTPSASEADKQGEG